MAFTTQARSTDSSAIVTTTPSEADRKNFRQLPSVEFWRNFYPTSGVNPAQSTSSQISSLLQDVQRGANSVGAFESAQSTAYWVYHVGRMAFFALQGVAGLASARSSAAASGQEEGSTGTRLEKLAASGVSGPVMEALATYAADYEHIKAGRYNLPWDMTSALHRQFNPLYVLPRVGWFVQEAADTLDRRDKQSSTDLWLSSNLGYPPYSLKTYHFQTDGWMSQRSAEIYEVSTETLFLGKQDAMQRQTLVLLSDHLASKVPNGAGLKALEVACGTGRFATFIKDNYPDMEMTCLDLSPFYLAKARENLKYWRSKRAPGSIDTDTFIQAAAENMPAEDNTYDVVTCVYLFHELPPESRRKVAAEMARVCKPGGMVVLTDSVQLGDRSAFDATLGKFSDFNEPFYGSYINEDLGSLMMDAGLTASSKTVASSTKSLSFFKPLTPLTASNRKAAEADAGPKSAPALATVVSPATAGRPSGLSRAISGVEEPRATFFT